MCLQYKSFENAAVFPSVFYLFGEICVIFNKFEIVVSQLFQFGSV